MKKMLPLRPRFFQVARATLLAAAATFTLAQAQPQETPQSFQPIAPKQPTKPAPGSALTVSSKSSGGTGSS